MKTPEFVSVGVAICIRGIGLSCLATACAPPRGQAVGAGCRRRGSWPPADWLRLGSQDVAAVVPGTAPGGHGGLVGGIGAVQGQYIARAVGVAGADDVGVGIARGGFQLLVLAFIVADRMQLPMPRRRPRSVFPYRPCRRGLGDAGACANAHVQCGSGGISQSICALLQN